MATLPQRTAVMLKHHGDTMTKNSIWLAFLAVSIASVVLCFIVLSQQHATPIKLTVSRTVMNQRSVFDVADATPSPAARAPQENRREALLAYIEILFNSSYDDPDGGCGSWQMDYMAQHARILSGQLPRRYLVSVAPPQGLADRLGGIATQFLAALLSKRAFLVATTPADTPALSLAFEHVSIASQMRDDFIRDKRLASTLLTSLTLNNYSDYHDRGILSRKQSCGLYLNAGKTPGQYFIVQARNEELFLHSNISNIPVIDTPSLRSPLDHDDCASAEDIYVMGNRGFTWRLFDNPYHAEQLAGTGMRRDTAFKCIMDFLFKFKPSTCGPSCVILRDQLLLARDSGHVVIGIQVRVGDEVFMKKPNQDSGRSNRHDESDSANPAQFAQGHLDCAQQLASELTFAGRKSKFLFLSDSQMLRQRVRAAYSVEQLLTDTSYQPVHVHHVGTRKSGPKRSPGLTGDGKLSSSRKQQMRNSITYAAADMHLLSLAHLHVISYSSGFGQKAAFLSHASSRVNIFNPAHGGNCSLLNYERRPADLWSGV